MKFSHTLGYGVAALAVIAGEPALAQEAVPEQAEDNGSGLTDIVVTARRVNENLQDVPVAVTAFSGDQLKSQNATELSDISRMTPGFTMASIVTNPSAATFQLRGQLQTFSTGNVDPSVGVYVDDYYWARAHGASAALLDIGSVQVLKGPQGTLFGRNTTGGAVLMKTNDPSFSGPSAALSATYGRFDAKQASAIVNLPLVDDRIAVRAAYQIDKRDGYINDVTSGRKLGSRNNWIGRAKLLMKPEDNISVLLSAELFKASGNLAPIKLAQLDPSSLMNLDAGLALFGAGDPATRSVQGYNYLSDYVAATKGASADVALSFVPFSKTKTWTYTGTATLDTFFGAIKFIGGFRKVKNVSHTDQDGTPLNLFDGDEYLNMNQYSGEVQFTGKAFGDRLDFSAGALYFHEGGTFGLSAGVFPDLFGPARTVYDSTPKSDSQGLYSQVSYHLTDSLTFTGGIRYSVDDKGLVIRNRSELPSGASFCLVDGTSPSQACAIGKRVSFDGWSYTAGLDYKVSDDILIYAKSSKGFRSGGINNNATGDPDATFISFRPEVVYEQAVGFKSELFDRRVRFNAEGFYSRLNDAQKVTLVLTSNGGTGSAIVNAGKARIYGFEAEANAVVFEGFTIGATAAMTKAKYLEFTEPATGLDRRSERFQQTPPWSLSFNALYFHQFEFGKLTLSGSYTWQADTPTYYYSPLAGDSSASTIDPATGKTIAQTIVDVTTQKAAGIVNARMALTFGQDEQFEVAIFGNNLTNDRGYVSGVNLPSPFGFTEASNREPTTYGLTATMKLGS